LRVEKSDEDEEKDQGSEDFPQANPEVLVRVLPSPVRENDAGSQTEDGKDP
tara:strand:- start:235 stop:387 length:153 start_codon:yes stop_codon:yes gene_type:complete